jgi:hypothetical protein
MVTIRSVKMAAPGSDRLDRRSRAPRPMPDAGRAVAQMTRTRHPSCRVVASVARLGSLRLARWPRLPVSPRAPTPAALDPSGRHRSVNLGEEKAADQSPPPPSRPPTPPSPPPQPEPQRRSLLSPRPLQLSPPTAISTCHHRDRPPRVSVMVRKLERLLVALRPRGCLSGQPRPLQHLVNERDTDIEPLRRLDRRQATVDGSQHPFPQIRRIALPGPPSLHPSPDHHNQEV